MYLPTGCWRQNFIPSNCRLRMRRQTFFSASVVASRSSRARTTLRGRPSPPPSPAGRGVKTPSPPAPGGEGGGEGGRASPLPLLQLLQRLRPVAAEEL